ncbi:MAG: hypothetical protein GX087_05275 [Desulfobulbaceae bacterium]|nr:hypothetical protein [Desulfobulbaceae bacterium]
MAKQKEATEERTITNYTGLYREAHGRSFFYLTCPWCGERVRCSIWSFSGVGKRCPDCGALHGPAGISRKKIEAGHAA